MLQYRTYSQSNCLAFDFLLHPNALKSLEIFRAVFQLTPGWRNGYDGRLVKTEIPSPFQSSSGLAPSGHLAVLVTARTRGSQLLDISIPEKFLMPYAPNKKDTLCMVIKNAEEEGGESVGSVLWAIQVSSKKKMVFVKRLDGTPAKELSLSFSRVIVVERGNP